MPNCVLAVGTLILDAYRIRREPSFPPILFVPKLLMLAPLSELNPLTLTTDTDNCLFTSNLSVSGRRRPPVPIVRR